MVWFRWWLRSAAHDGGASYLETWRGLAFWRKTLIAVVVLAAPLLHALMRLVMPPWQEARPGPFTTGTRRSDFPAGDYLSDDEVQHFERDGFTRPFMVLPREEALRLKTVVEKKIMGGEVVQGLLTGQSGAEREAWLARLEIRETCRLRGFDRHKNVPEIQAILASPELCERMETLSIVHVLSTADARTMLFQYLVGVADPDLYPMFDLVRRILGQTGLELETKREPILLRAGEAILFTSKCVHGSLPNTSPDQRFALVGRYTTPEVDVYPGERPDFHFGRGVFPLPVKVAKTRLRPVTVHGNCDRYLADWPAPSEPVS